MKQRNFAWFVGCYSSDFASWISWLYNYALKFEQCAHGAVSVPYGLLAAFHQIQICALIPTASFGVFAGSAFKKDELLPGAWKSMFLPKNFPSNQVLRNYVFGYNETHMVLVLDYASNINHHDSANVHAVRFLEMPPGNDLQFRVCMVLCVRIAML